MVKRRHSSGAQALNRTEPGSRSSPGTAADRAAGRRGCACQGRTCAGRAGRSRAPARTAAQEPAVFLPGQVDRAEGGRGEGGEHAWVGGDTLGDALAAGLGRPAFSGQLN